MLFVTGGVIMNCLAVEGVGVITRLHTRSLNVRTELKQLATGSYSEPDLLIRIERLKRQADEAFKDEEGVMGEYHYSPVHHVAEHRDFMNLFAYLEKNPSKAVICDVYNRMVNHAAYHDDCFANHFERLMLKQA